MNDNLKPPVARYRLEIVITGNTIDELVHELRVQANDFDYESFAGRTIRSIYGGRHHLIVTEPNPDMTPEQYDTDLSAWAKARRFVRSEGEDLTN